MTALETELLVIGGGATGAGVVWDAALRGFDAVLVERRDLAEGTSGRFHGLLHSGARYVVKDPSAAKECIDENRVVRRILPGCVEDTGGLFVTTPWDDPAYGDRLLEGCAASGVPCEEIDVAEALRSEPRLHPGMSRAFTVPDANVEVWKLVWTLARAASERGARIMPYHRVVGFVREGDAVRGARVRDERSGDELEIRARVTINASGAWAAQLAGMAGAEGVGVVPGKGIMIAMNHRLVNTVVNRCEMPGDGDILVPIRTVSVIGTTDSRVPDPDELPVTQAEVDQMLDDGEKLVPGFREARALRVWAGVRPLFQDAKSESVSDTREVSRSHALLDHRERDGIDGFLTITGGKLTSFRLMAEETVDAACAQLGEPRPCTTAEHVLDGAANGDSYHLGERLRAREETLQDDELICECELIPRRRLEAAIRERGTHNLDDLRRNLRLGMGPCQGGFCIYRATGIMHAVERLDGAEANAALRDFVDERWKGVWPILYGDQLRQAWFDEWVFQGLLDVEHLPDGANGLGREPAAAEPRADEHGAPADPVAAGAEVAAREPAATRPAGGEPGPPS